MTLVTTLLTLLLGVLALASDSAPLFLRSPEIKYLGVAAIALLFIALATSLVVVVPLSEIATSARADTQAAAFLRLLRGKSQALTVSAVAFALGLLALSILLVFGLLVA